MTDISRLKTKRKGGKQRGKEEYKAEGKKTKRKGGNQRGKEENKEERRKTKRKGGKQRGNEIWEKGDSSHIKGVERSLDLVHHAISLRAISQYKEHSLEQKK